MQEQRVIIIDDDRLNNLVCRSFIHAVSDGTEPQVVEFTNPEEGLHYVHDTCKKLHGEHILLLLDLNMPIMSGWEFLDEFAKLDDCCKQSFTIFIVSSSLDPKDHNRAHEDPNVAGLIVKPLSREIIRGLIQHPANAAA